MRALPIVIFSIWIIPAIVSVCHAETPAELAVHGTETLARDIWAVVSAPARLRKDHLPVLLTAAGVAFLPAIIDRPCNDAIGGTTSRDLDRVYDAVEPFGRVRAAYIAGGIVLTGGLATGSKRAVRAGVECMEAGLITVTLTSLLKNATGRSRPGETSDPFIFHPFDRGNSWPSNHAAQSFATATVFSSYTPWWGDALLYAGASTVSVFDLYDNRHWASDIAGGAVLGWAIGRAMVQLHDCRKNDIPERYSITLGTVGIPTNGTGLFMTARF